MSVRERWKERADALARFRVEHRRWPRPNADTPLEQELHRWLRPMSWRRNPERDAYLDKVAPGWNHPDRLFRDHADEVAWWRTQYGRLPHNKGALPHEARLANWLSFANRSDTPPSRREYLTQVCPGWERPSRQHAWETRFAELETFITTTGRLPRETPHDPAERSLAKWLYKQGRAATLTPERAARLDTLRDHAR